MTLEQKQLIEEIKAKLAKLAKQTEKGDYEIPHAEAG